MNDGQFVRIYRAVRRLRKIVVHQSEVRRRQEERDGLCPYPIAQARPERRIDRIALEEGHGTSSDSDVQYRNRDDVAIKNHIAT